MTRGTSSKLIHPNRFEAHALEDFLMGFVALLNLAMRGNIAVATSIEEAPMARVCH
ncbi:MAG TPA: hypothetical protein VEX68_19710 [Bryobacteraceae bacterium]|nr:hypothetical protein [Bryobacteraceae bacterium]